MQLKVIKADGSVEEYLHTKIIGTIGCVLAQVGQADTYIAEHLAEAVTFFLYHKQKRFTVSSSEIFSIIEAVLAATKYEDAAIALSEHHFARRLKRSRTEVITMDIQQPGDVEMLCNADESIGRSRWDKSRIVADLMTRHGISRQTARTIASMVEEKVFNMGLTLVPAALIKQLVLGDTAAILRAERLLAV